MKKLGINLPHDLATPLLGIYPEKIIIKNNTCTPMLMAALFTVARTGKQPRRPLTDEWIRKTCYIHTMGCSVQVSSVAQSCPTLQPHESQLARPPGVHSDSCPSSQWCDPAISYSVIPFFSCPQSLPASESFPMSQLFAWGGQNTAVSALASFLPKNTQG